MWKELLFTGGVECTPYDIEWDTILMTLQRGWNGFQMRDFLLSRDEVLKVTWDSKDYFKEGVTEADLSEEGDESSAPAKKSTKRRKKREEEKDEKKKKKEEEEEERRGQRQRQAQIIEQLARKRVEPRRKEE